MSQFVTPSYTLQRVNEVVAIITQRNVDIAPDYQTYLHIGFAFAHEFGEGGHEIFHQVCQPSHKYKHADAERQYTACLRARGRGITVGTFFHYTKQAGLH